MAASSNHRRILVPVDISAVGDTKIPVVEEYAHALDADVLLLHVLPSRALDPTAVHPVEAAARTYLDTVAVRLRGSGLQAETILRTGPVAATILEEAEIRGVKLIVLGTNIRPSLPSALLGSVADQVARSAPCPVLLVHPDIRALPRG